MDLVITARTLWVGDEPFVGLRSMREEESGRFFGRSAEIAELVERFRRHRIVAIVADSGTGKSSLARAEFIRAFRGGALIDPMRAKRSGRSSRARPLFALQCELPSSKTSTLLIVDQFDELFTTTPDALAAPFVKLLLAPADGPCDVRVLITVRADYFNLASGIRDASDKPALFERLTAENNAAILPSRPFRR